MIFSHCTVCLRALSKPGGAWYCDRCWRYPNLCSLCHRVVKGLFVWCQGCAHGGHVEHMREWYAKNRLCPAGCGHYCEFE